MYSELTYELALAEVPHVGYVHAKSLIEHFRSAEAVFKASPHVLERIEGIGEIRAKSIKSFRDFTGAAKEEAFIQRYGIECLYLSHPSYPQRLLNCYDPPTNLFFKGNVSLNSSRLVAVVGTRSNTEYGKSFTEKLVKKLADFNCVIVSGLAFGIDAIAHKCAIKHDVPTIAVVGHGLDTIYPQEHATLAKQMLKNGGILTEFRSGTKPDKHNSPSRNRVVAGICDATVIVESGSKGGSMITAELADDYHRDVFALPGRVTDVKSAGCNELIKKNKAQILTDPDQFIEVMGWNIEKPGSRIQSEMFISLSEEEKKVVQLLRNYELMSIDQLNFQCGVSSSSLAASLLNLELNNVIKPLPGQRYCLVNR